MTTRLPTLSFLCTRAHSFVYCLSYGTYLYSSIWWDMNLLPYIHTPYNFVTMFSFFLVFEWSRGTSRCHCPPTNPPTNPHFSLAAYSTLNYIFPQSTDMQHPTPSTLLLQWAKFVSHVQTSSFLSYHLPLDAVWYTFWCFIVYTFNWFSLPLLG